MQEKLAESEDARRDVVWAIEQLGHSARAKSAGMASAVDCPLAEGKVNAEQAEVWFLQLQTEAVAILEELTLTARRVYGPSHPQTKLFEHHFELSKSDPRLVVRAPSV